MSPLHNIAENLDQDDQDALRDFFLSLYPFKIERNIKLLLHRMNKKRRELLCVLWNGKHELYRARTDVRLFQECVNCGYQTKGWTIDRRDRRLHLVKSNRTR